MPVSGPAATAEVGTRVVRAAPRLGSYDALALFSIVAFVAHVVLALLGGGGRALSVSYPIGCFIVGLITYARSPRAYIAFTWWIWLLTPLVRRVFDLRYGYHPTSSLLLGPLLVTSVAVLTVLRQRRMLRSSAYVPFLIAATALSYAFLVGVIRQSPVAAAYDMMTWTAPLLFGFHVALEWRQFPQLSRTILSCVIYGLMVVSLYGLVQFVNPPMWDRAWVLNADMFSVGTPAPFVIRVFSTLNAPGPCSIMLLFSLLLGVSAPQRWRAIALALGLVALILTKGRSAWGAFLLGAFVLQLRQPIRSLPRQWLAVGVVILMAAPVITQPRVMAVLTGRAASLGNVSGDQSFLARVALTRDAIGNIASDPVGVGLGKLGGASKLLTGGNSSVALDSGPLEVFTLMGWIGGTLYMMALVAIVLPLARRPRVLYEQMTAAGTATVAALLVTSLFGNIFTNVSGFFFWSAIGLATAGRTYATGAELATRFNTLRSGTMMQALDQQPSVA